MRKIIYSIGFFWSLLILSAIAYNYYQVNVLRAQVNDMREEISQPMISVDTPVLQQGYYLLEKDGLVCVYRGDRTTIYETTSIAMDSLPDKLREEIRDGKLLDSEIELYSFLENYSS